MVMAIQEMAIQDTMTLGLILVNIIISIVLVYIYLRNYTTLKAKVSLGLFIFALLFLLGNVVDFYFYDVLLSKGVFGVTSHPFSINFIEMIGLIIILWITWK